MATTIQDGTGFGFQTQVDNTNRLRTRSISEDTRIEGAFNGDTYIIGSPFVNITGSTGVVPYGLLYFKHTENVSLFTRTFSSQARYASGSTIQNYLIVAYKDIDDSLLDSNWTSFTPLNANFGSSNELAGVFKYGQVGGSFGSWTGLTPSFVLGFPVNVYNQIESSLVFPKGVGVLLAVIPPVGSTTMPVSFTITVTKNIE